MQIAVDIVCVLAIALSAKSVIVLGRAALWTTIAWWATIAYFMAVLVKLTVFPGLATLIEYVPLTVLALSFVVAGIRDEPQAEPWWWPTRLGETRAQKRLGQEVRRV